MCPTTATRTILQSPHEQEVIAILHKKVLATYEIQQENEISLKCREAILLSEENTITASTWCLSDPHTILLGTQDGKQKQINVKDTTLRAEQQTKDSLPIQDLMFHPYDSNKLAIAIESSIESCLVWDQERFMSSFLNNTTTSSNIKKNIQKLPKIISYEMLRIPSYKHLLNVAESLSVLETTPSIYVPLQDVMFEKSFVQGCSAVSWVSPSALQVCYISIDYDIIDGIIYIH